MLSINDFFTSESINQAGTVDMCSFGVENRKGFYLTNVYNDKLLKISIKSEPRKGQEEACAQIKIIGYGIKRAHVWEDRQGSPRVECLPDVVEMTYHGAQHDKKRPKVHVKAKSGYKTLIDNSLRLPVSTQAPVPLFAIEPGYKNREKWGNPVIKKAHVVSTEDSGHVRVDFYLAGSDMDFAAFFSSMYFFNLFFTQDYLLAAENHPLTGGRIIAPIHVLKMGEYLLFVRRSLSSYRGRPYLNFYANKDYREKFLNRRVAHKAADGSMQWSTMIEEEERLRSQSAGRG